MRKTFSGYAVIALMHLLSWLPLWLLRAIGCTAGQLLFWLARPRRRVALTNLRLCFPQTDEPTRRRWVRASFIYFCQTWLDRSWLWLGSPRLLRRRLHLHGALEQYQQPGAVIVLTPHFYGLDAAAMAMALHNDRPVASIFMKQPNPVLDAWIKAGRARFGEVRLINRAEGLRPVIQTLRKGGVLYLLPDMNFAADESIFVPFFSVPTATVPSLSRFAQMGRARVMPLLSRVTRQGYDIELLPAWQDFPTGDVPADTTRMNAELEGWIRSMPAQYFWVHKRFKSRPPGEPPVY
ncbi:lipid A biosynthesis acyltransferase [Corticibacter populi]|uniref:Lipid A biosynthesis acyltransferase n=1 Tax=Corticibacter populi TaxID=1550736 RepID=A0A3M6QPI0_9BURK|nr:lipid A biosynthesis acyltransferase [Corticibacter populi]RMX04956.1 lipid A biosynthesis acyltransferase [Corticibacter populi]RZS33617.1 KDO2-lipid IV(A) lauroyltransferase [Corticibacter populi]